MAAHCRLIAAVAPACVPPSLALCAHMDIEVEPGASQVPGLSNRVHLADLMCHPTRKCWSICWLAIFSRTSENALCRHIGRCGGNGSSVHAFGVIKRSCTGDVGSRRTKLWQGTAGWCALLLENHCTWRETVASSQADLCDIKHTFFFLYSQGFTFSLKGDVPFSVPLIPRWREFKRRV